MKNKFFHRLSTPLLSLFPSGALFPSRALFSSMVLIASLSGAVSAQETPDLNGLWFPQGFGSQSPSQTPFNSFAQGLYDTYVATFNVDDDPGGFCIKPGLPRSIWGAPFPVEIVQTDAFINMFWEGYFQYRKIYMRDYPHPEPILHSRMGYSVGHWEEQVLVIETSYLRQYSNMRRLPNTDDATVVERISIETRTDASGQSNQYLVNAMTLTDSRLYSEPVTVTGTLAYSPDTPIMEYSCSEGLYDQYLQENNLQTPDFDQ